MSLLRLYAYGIQSDYITNTIIYNINNIYDNECKDCINNNRKPKLFYYYGPRLCSKICLPDYKIKYYNTICDRDHYFITSSFEK